MITSQKNAGRLSISLFLVASFVVYLVLSSLFYSIKYSSAQIKSQLRTLPNTTYLTFESLDYGIKIKYPSDWVKNEYPTNIGGNNSIVDFYPRENGSGNSYESVNLFVFPTANTTSLHQIVNGTMTNIASSNGNTSRFSLIEQKQVPIKGQYAYLVNYLLRTVHHSFEKMQLWRLINNNVYVLTYTADPSKYSFYLPTVQKMFDSVEINNVSSSNNILPNSNSTS